MSRFQMLFGLALCLSVSTASDVAAQRKGFIIGFGVGPGVTTGDVDSKVGLAMDFKIGAMLGESVQLHYSGKSNLLIYGEDVVLSSLGGLGVTYQMASGFNINGTAGLATWTRADSHSSNGSAGFGLGAGVGYEFAAHWVLNLGGTWGILDDRHIINIAATISILSH